MRSVVWAAAAVLTGLAIFEASMQPTVADRLELSMIFAMMAIAMAVTARWLPQVARRQRSIKVTIAVVAVTAFSIVVTGAVLVGTRMFISRHDLTLLLVVLAFGIVAGLGFAVSVSRSLTDDLASLSSSASEVAAGNLKANPHLDRVDEIGRLSLALEHMVSKLGEAEAERVAHAASRRDFLSAVGHDLRTPLASIRASVEAVEDGVATNTALQIEAIQRDIGVLMELIEEVYLLARLDSGTILVEREPIDVTELCDETREVLGPIAARRGVSLQLLADQRHLALADQEYVGRVLRNLGDNAIRHAPAGSIVTLSVDNIAGKIVVSVSDEGPGFPTEFLPVAFERFTTVGGSGRSEQGGWGMGLAIAGELVESMGGSIWIEPESGGKVSFELTAADARSERPLSV